MTANSKRPFYVFAAVAFLCCMVMVAGVRGSRADDGRTPLLAGPQILERAPTLIPSTAATDVLADERGTGGPGPAPSGETSPDRDPTPVESEIEGRDTPDVENSGIGVLFQDSSVPPETIGPGVTPSVTEDEPGTKARGHKKGKGKDKGEDKDGPGGPPGPETPPADPPTNPVAPETQSEDLEPEAEPTP